MFRFLKRNWTSFAESWHAYWLRREYRRYESRARFSRRWEGLRDRLESWGNSNERAQSRLIGWFLGLRLWSALGGAARLPALWMEVRFSRLETKLQSIRLPLLARIVNRLSQTIAAADYQLFVSSQRWGARLRESRWLQAGVAAVGFCSIAAVVGVVHEEPHWKAMAAMHFARRDYVAKNPSARASVVKAIRLDPSNAEGWRMLAHLTEQERTAGAEVIWARAATLDPDDTDSLIGCARTALAGGNLELASQALEKVPPAKRQNAEYASLAGDLARRRGQYAAAVAAFSLSVALDPTRLYAVLSLAALRSDSRDPKERMQGIGVLEHFRTDPNPLVKAEALRNLLRAAAQERNAAQLNVLSVELAESPKRTVADVGLILDAWRVGAPSGLDPAVRQAQSRFAANSAEVAAVMGWMNVHQKAADTLTWAEALPQPITRQPAVALVIAEAWRLTQNWAGLARWSAAAHWGNLTYLGNAFSALAAAKQGDAELFEQQWRRAVETARTQTGDLYTLAVSAFNWGLADQAVKLWWELKDDPVVGFNSLASLARYYQARRDADNLVRAFLGLHEIVGPSDPRVENNFAYLAALTGSHQEMAVEVAARIHNADPANVNYASTWAFVLWRNRRLPEALYEVRRLLPSVKEHPEIALTCGLVLDAGGYREQAQGLLRSVPTETLTLAEQKLLAAHYPKLHS